MTQAVWSEDAKTVLDFLYRFWAEKRRPPHVGDVHHGTGFGFRAIRRCYRELQQGFAVVADDSLLNLNLQKVTPFSATPTPVSFDLHGAFHSYVGCPAEALTVGCLPMFANETLEVNSYCSCCYAPIALKVRGLDVIEASPAEPIVAIVASPYEWECGVAADHVCDSIRFVLDDDHGRRYARQIGRVATFMTMPQLRELARPVAEGRMWNPQWPPIRVDGAAMIDRHEQLGVDVGAWREPEGRSSDESES